ncbi:hypothetical protein AOQ84DRAFT_379025, partial [Glonium stellatum]
SGLGGLGTRESVATARSSFARFRSIDSWVSQQAARVEEQRLREVLRTPVGARGEGGVGAGSGLGSGAGAAVAPAAAAAAAVGDGESSGGASPVAGSRASIGTGLDAGGEGVPEVPDLPPYASLLGVPGGVPGGRPRLQRHDSEATEATVFRQHPGTEVRMSVRSLVPSEILNSKMKPSVL